MLFISIYNDKTIKKIDKLSVINSWFIETNIGLNKKNINIIIFNFWFFKNLLKIEYVKYFVYKLLTLDYLKTLKEIMDIQVFL